MSISANTYLGGGLAFPVAPGPTGDFRLVRGYDVLPQSIFRILDTPVGTDFNNPNFGSRLHELHFQPLDSGTESLLKQLVKDALKQWEKRIRVQSVATNILPDLARIDSTITYTVLASNEIQSLVYPFYSQP